MKPTSPWVAYLLMTLLWLALTYAVHLLARKLSPHVLGRRDPVSLLAWGIVVAALLYASSP